MQTKTFRVKTANKDAFIEKKGHFGWEFAASSIDRNGVTSVSLKRDKNMDNYKIVRKLEKQHRRINHFPWLSTLILVVIGVSLLIPYFFLRNTHYWYLLFIIPALFLFFIALFNVGVFLMLQPQRNKLNKELYNEADIITGKIKRAPYPDNVIPQTENSFRIKKHLYKKD